ncbi:MAG: hypothetical protein IJT88_05310 [Kiritimatiellae bacterium]|nr:hypothetical protein [Kiritimatiellia bacterium]
MAPREGNIVDTSGRVLGTHRDYWNYIVGKRRGLGIGGGRKLYVLGVDACRNEVTVGDAEETRCAALRIADESWVAGRRPDDGQVQCKIRFASAPLDAEWDGASQTVRFAPPCAQGAAPGQSAVLYRGDEAPGGGVIVQAR